MDLHLIFAKLAWLFLIAVMLIRPVNDVFCFGLCRSGMRYRKYLGIAAGIFAVLHVIWFMVEYGLDVGFFIGPVWDFTNLFGWGMLALIFILPPLLTSNVWSQKIFQKNWKLIQKLSYLAFVFTGIHIAFIVDRLWVGLVPVVVWLIFVIVANVKKDCQKNYCKK